MVRIKTMRQWQFDTFNHFLVAFKYQQKLTGIRDVEHIRWDFLEALVKPLAEKVKGVNPNDVNTLDKLYAMAAKFDEAHQYDTRKSDPTPWTSKNRTGRRIQWGGRKNQGKGVNIKKLTPNEYEEHRKKNLCFKCHQPGHISRNCLAGKQQIREIETAAAAIEDKDTPTPEVKKLILNLDQHDPLTEFDLFLSSKDF